MLRLKSFFVIFKFVIFSFCCTGLLIKYLPAQEKFKIEHIGNYKSIDGKPGVSLLTGDVVLSQGDMKIKCEKAEYNNDNGNFESLSRTQVIKGTMNIFTDKLLYDNVKRIGKFRKNIELVEGSQTLYTDFLDFNIGQNSGYFYNGGKIIDSSQTTESRRGYYYPQKNTYTFIDSVVVHNQNSVLYSDTLEYQLTTKRVLVLGPTRIFGENGNYIYCENGWYDTKKEVAQILKKGYLKNKNQRISGDTLYYDRFKGIGRAYGNILMFDSTKNITITGRYAEYFENPEKALVTGKALFTQVSYSDSMFMHADTLRSIFDTAGDYRILKAYYKAQAFKDDFQCRSDSISYSMKDSVIHLYYQPVMWTGNQQITAKEVHVFMKKGELDSAVMESESFVVALDSADKYNQVSGVKMIGYFADNEIYKIDVLEKGKTAHYVKDDTDYIGLNIVECAKMVIYLEKKEIADVLFKDQPKGSLLPLEQIGSGQDKLEGFQWFEQYRPAKKEDIFEWKIIEKISKSEETKKEVIKDTKKSKPSLKKNDNLRKTKPAK